MGVQLAAAMKSFLLFAVVACPVLGLQNGLGLTPPMGYSSWNDCASEITEARIKNITLALISTGLAAKGYVHVNVDEGWLKSRDATTGGMIISDPVKFPSGMKALGDWIHNQSVPGKGKIMKYGLYTCRGTCQCSTALYKGPGSHGFVEQDAKYLADAGADYLKEDSCCGDQDHATAFGDYAEMRDALNKTGRSIYFSLCGWNTWYAPQGDNLGNSWRIAGDGTNWGALSQCMNKNALLQQYARPGAWNDPDLLQGTGKGSNDKATNPSGCYIPSSMPQTQNWYQTIPQAKAQFTFWALMSSPLLIAADPGQVESELIEYWGNEEIIEVSQTFRAGGPYQAGRIYGGDVDYDPKSNMGHGTNVWGKLLPGNATHAPGFALGFLNNEVNKTNVTCDSDCFSQMFDFSQVLPKSLAVRDLWAHAALPSLSPPYKFTSELDPNGGSAVYRFYPSM